MSNEADMLQDRGLKDVRVPSYAQKRLWRTPMVITGTIGDTETNAGTGADGNATNGHNLS